MDAAFDDVADRDQPHHLAVLDYGQVAELADRHHFHDPGDGVGFPATHDLARHDSTHRLLDHPGAALAQHPDNVPLGKDALEPVPVHHQHGADLAFAKDLDRSRKLGLRLYAQDLMALGIEN